MNKNSTSVLSLLILATLNSEYTYAQGGEDSLPPPMLDDNQGYHAIPMNSDVLPPPPPPVFHAVEGASLVDELKLKQISGLKHTDGPQSNVIFDENSLLTEIKTGVELKAAEISTGPVSSDTNITKEQIIQESIEKLKLLEKERKDFIKFEEVNNEVKKWDTRLNEIKKQIDILVDKIEEIKKKKKNADVQDLENQKLKLVEEYNRAKKEKSIYDSKKMGMTQHNRTTAIETSKHIMRIISEEIKNQANNNQTKDKITKNDVPAMKNPKNFGFSRAKAMVGFNVFGQWKTGASPKIMEAVMAQEVNFNKPFADDKREESAPPLTLEIKKAFDIKNKALSLITKGKSLNIVDVPSFGFYDKPLWAREYDKLTEDIENEGLMQSIFEPSENDCALFQSIASTNAFKNAQKISLGDKWEHSEKTKKFWEDRAQEQKQWKLDWQKTNERLHVYHMDNMLETLKGKGDYKAYNSVFKVYYQYLLSDANNNLHQHHIDTVLENYESHIDYLLNDKRKKNQYTEFYEIYNASYTFAKNLADSSLHKKILGDKLADHYKKGPSRITSWWKREE